MKEPITIKDFFCVCSLMIIYALGISLLILFFNFVDKM